LNREGPTPDGGNGSADLSGIVSQVDHLVYGAPDLALGVAGIEELLGVRASAGGQHPGRGTHNALLALGARAYLEIVAPDPEQPPPASPRWFGLDQLDSPRLIAWAAHAEHLEALGADAAERGLALGPVAEGGRARPDGTRLSWRFTDPTTRIADGIVPFFIDWGSAPHPARTAAVGATLLDLRGEHPDPARVRRMLDAVGVDLAVARAERPALIATIDSPRGLVELR
jgi:hypothetical protein